MKVIEKLEVPMSKDTRIALLEQLIGHINESLQRIDIRFSYIEQILNDHFKEIDKKLDKSSERLWSNFYWILGTMFSLACAGAAVLAKGFGWFN